jgi:hypothetical protein
MTIKALYPTVRPTLNLDFAKTKALDPRVTFTRASTATFVGANGLIQTAASGAARFDHNPATGESLGLLVEEARTNRHTYSEQFDNAAWSKYGATITANATTAPDGTTTADKFASTSGAALIAVQQADTTLTNGASYTRTVFAKASEISSLTLQVGNTSTGTVFVQANLSAGTATSGGVVTTLANGWFRISYSYTQSGTTGDFYLRLPDNTVAGSGVFLWGAQLEAGSFPTSYIPTTTATVTRAADIASITGTNFSSWYRQDEGSLVGSFIASNSSTNVPLAAFYNAANLSNYRISFRPGNTFAKNVSSQFEFTTSYSSNILNKFAWGFGSTAVASKNGSIFGTDNSVSLPLNLDRAVIGQVEGSGIWLNGTIARLTYYPARLPDAQLQALTAT